MPHGCLARHDGFNPYRVFEYAATALGRLALRALLVRFNPYRVFEYVATYAFSGSSYVNTLFQSLSGFRVRCNTPGFPSGDMLMSCFNPYRVFEYVATLWFQAHGANTVSFNPYRVFEYVATFWQPALL